MNGPRCLVLMPFGRKRDLDSGREIDFDRIYREAVLPAAHAAGLQCMRPDDVSFGGLIERSIIEAVLLAEVVIADVTTSNPNVFYELGVRHAARAGTTLLMAARGTSSPLGLIGLAIFSYDLGEENRFSEREAQNLRTALTEQLLQVRKAPERTDSPVFKLLSAYRGPRLDGLREDAAADEAVKSQSIRTRIAELRTLPPSQASERLATLASELGTFEGVEPEALVDLFLAYRSTGAWNQMVSLYERLPGRVQRAAVVREQLAFALNRQAASTRDPSTAGALRERALATLNELERESGIRGETAGLKGRIYKDLWTEATGRGEQDAAHRYLLGAIEAYTRGFEADWRDIYPGVNAVTLLQVEGSADSLSRLARLLPGVRFSAEQKLRAEPTDYWNHATLLELAVVARDREAARAHLAQASAVVRAPWEPETTARNLTLLVESASRHGDDMEWVRPIIAELRQLPKAR